MSCCKENPNIINELNIIVEGAVKANKARGCNGDCHNCPKNGRSIQFSTNRRTQS